MDGERSKRARLRKETLDLRSPWMDIRELLRSALPFMFELLMFRALSLRDMKFLTPSRTVRVMLRRSPTSQEPKESSSERTFIIPFTGSAA